MKEDSAEKIYEKIVQYADLKNKEILEVGCGDGRISSLLAGDCELLVAIDPDIDSIEHAKTNISGVDFRLGSGEELDFPDNCFDLVIFTLSLHHQNSKKAIAEAARVLKADGKILVIEPVVDGEVERVFAFLHNENNEHRKVQQSIKDSRLSIVNTDVFTANWIFRDKNDLIQSLFHYYDKPFDPDIEHEIITLLGDKIKSEPIVLIDSMIIQSLMVP
jgi:ubiquinone/menaquinone biosynthesis C-methylase UbiE